MHIINTSKGAESEYFEKQVKEAVLRSKEYLEVMFGVEGIDDNIFELRDLYRITRDVVKEDNELSLQQAFENYRAASKSEKKKVWKEEVREAMMSKFFSVHDEIALRWIMKTCNIDVWGRVRFPHDAIKSLIRIRRHQRSILSNL